MKFKISKSQWEDMGKKAGWMKKAQFSDNFDSIEIGTTPSEEDCAQVGSKDYDYYELVKMELESFHRQLLRAFPNTPDGIRFKKQSNPHDFGTYYDLVIRFNSDSEEAVNYAFNIENNTPKQWDDQARSELESKGYFQKLHPNKNEQYMCENCGAESHHTEECPYSFGANLR